ncbi:MAG: hypothetical protein EA359_03085 [Balneolaceae bacterium]|nr:MAG: hypothetical protein EA359_03085 [Balneolaceae bacterium]
MSNVMHKIWTCLVLLLAAEMALVYPVHIIVDHTGLFGHHHEHDNNHSSEDHPEDDVCLFCMNLGGMEHSEALFAQPAVSESTGFTDVNELLETGTELFIQTRAPPLAPLPNG